jgi:F-type H+-transporting ATPase subunit epsilon
VSKLLHLTITTPLTVLVDADVRSVRAEDESGGFGILAGHADLLTVLTASVVRWRTDDGERYCALRGGLMTVAAGRRVAIACREGTVGDNLPALETEVRKLREVEIDAERNTRVEQTRLHAHAIRQIIRYLRPGLSADGPPFLPPGERP